MAKLSKRPGYGAFLQASAEVPWPYAKADSQPAAPLTHYPDRAPPPAPLPARHERYLQTAQPPLACTSQVRSVTALHLFLRLTAFPHNWSNGQINCSSDQLRSTLTRLLLTRKPRAVLIRRASGWWLPRCNGRALQTASSAAAGSDEVGRAVFAGVASTKPRTAFLVELSGPRLLEARSPA